ncbi:MAG: nodulation protein NfeD [Dehalococcoidia bacterium]
MWSVAKYLRLVVFLGFLLLLAAAFTPARAATPTVYVMRVQGAIVPVVADYIHRGIEKAEAEGASALIIELDTPGGLVSSSQKIIQDFLVAEVPIVVYVSPAGGWAGSAGAFITIAAHVAAMAPGTFIGAAHPVSIGPSGESETSKTMEEKTVNALASAIKSIAEKRHRTVEVAEDMVRKSVAKTDSEALELNIIDLRSENLKELLDQLEGRQVTLAEDKVVTLETEGARIERVDMTSRENILLTLSNPNIAYLLLSLAMLGIFLELSNPGSILPGVFGGIALFLALYSLGTLQANYAGILLIILGFGLFLAEIFVLSSGILIVGGIASLAFGSLILFSGTPAFEINRGLIAGVVGGVTAVFIFVVGAVVRSHRRPQVTGREGMVGMTATVKTPLEPTGTVSVHGETWRATLDRGRASVGEEVVVTKVEALKLRVARKKERTRGGEAKPY